MKRILIIVVIVVILFVFVAIGIFILNPKQTIPSSSSSPGFPLSSSVTTPALTSTSTTNTQMSVTTYSGSTIKTKDFLLDPSTVSDPVNQGYYYLGNNTFGNQVNSNPQYLIEYIEKTQYFNIELLQEPLGEARKSAEQYLLQHLGITQDQMCQLNYNVGTPDSVNTLYATMNLGFSFCPGAIALPQ